MSWIYFNPNPVHPEGGVGDCSVRAVAKALNISWEDAYLKLATNGMLMGDMMNSDVVWGSVLRQNGFFREIVPNTCPDCYTLGEFCNDNPRGVLVVKSEGHVATVIDSILFDSWNSLNKIPIYYWTRKDNK